MLLILHFCYHYFIYLYEEEEEEKQKICTVLVHIQLISFADFVFLNSFSLRLFYSGS